MRVFSINKINYKTRYPIVFEKVETLFASLLILYKEFFDMITDKDGDNIKTEQERCTQQEGKIQDFLSSLEKRYFELEAEEVSTREASVPALDKSVADFEQVMKK